MEIDTQTNIFDLYQGTKKNKIKSGYLTCVIIFCDPQLFTLIFAGVSMSVCPSVRYQLVKILITLGPYGIFFYHILHVNIVLPLPCVTAF